MVCVYTGIMCTSENIWPGISCLNKDESQKSKTGAKEHVTDEYLIWFYLYKAETAEQYVH